VKLFVQNKKMPLLLFEQKMLTLQKEELELIATIFPKQNKCYNKIININ